MLDYLWNVLIWIDQGVNVLVAPVLNLVLRPKLGRFGNPDETLSSVFGKNSDNCNLCRYICWALNFIEKDHCKKSIEWDESDKK